jgi:hypothetical protein
MNARAPEHDVFRILTAAEFAAESAAYFAPPPLVSKFNGFFVHERVGTPPKREWILKNVFLAKTFFLIVGQPGCGKSFLALDFAMARAIAAVDPSRPQEWCGRKFKPGATVYIAGEGQDDFLIRQYAWLDHNAVPRETRLPIFVIPTAVDLRSSDEIAKALIAEIKAVDAICQSEFNCTVDLCIVDTFNKSLAGGDDAKPEHVGAFIRHAALIREETGCAVGAIHHTPLGAQRARGHGSITADNDGEIFVSPAEDGAPNNWKITRNKAGPSGARFDFRLTKQVVGRDEDGDEISSCVCRFVGAEASIEDSEMRDAAMMYKTGKPTVTADGRAILGGNLTLALRALQSCIDERGRQAPPNIRAPHARLCVTETEWLDEICRIRPGYDENDPKSKDAARKMRDNASTAAQNRGLIGADNKWVWRTERRVASIDRPQFSEHSAPFSKSGGRNSANDDKNSIDIDDVRF